MHIKLSACTVHSGAILAELLYVIKFKLRYFLDRLYILIEYVILFLISVYQKWMKDNGGAIINILMDFHRGVPMMA